MGLLAREHILSQGNTLFLKRTCHFLSLENTFFQRDVDDFAVAGFRVSGLVHGVDVPGLLARDYRDLRYLALKRRNGAAGRSEEEQHSL